MASGHAEARELQRGDAAVSLADRWPLPDHHALRDELLAAWDRAGYHDLRHLEEVLDRLDVLAAAGAPFDRTVVALAAWFHDAVYDGADDDEERSARWAERALPPAWADEVARLVRMTVEHRPGRGRPGRRPLSATPTWASWPRPGDGTTPTWPACGRTSRTSATTTSGPAGQPCCATWSPGRHLFSTPHARELWEDAARANLRRELAGLEGLSGR